MEAAEQVSRADQDAAIILITTSEEYGIAGYSFAVFYIVKPVQEKNLSEAMKKCRVQIERYAKTIEVMVDRQLVGLRLRNIYCVESLGRTCIFTTAAAEITASNLIMDGLVEKLGGFPFVQCHRSYIVNLLHVKDLQEKNFIIENGRSVPISRTYHSASQKAFRAYFWNRIQEGRV